MGTPTNAGTPEVRTGQGSMRLTYEEFAARRRATFNEAFEDLPAEREALIRRAWEIYEGRLPSEAQVPMGPGAADPTFEVSAEWWRTSQELQRLERRQKSSETPRRVLLVNGSPRNDNTCPHEMSKTHRLCGLARAEIEKAGVEVDYLDLSRITGEYGKHIHPCKGCVSTAMPLCHWPCSCYPNHRLGQTQDWMAEIYGKWVAAHGVMIVTPVHWYSPPSVLKLMMDRLVCADGGNPDPSTTRGKTAALAKELELGGWGFPRHLAGRLFAVVAHGDTEGARGVKQAVSEWLLDMKLVSAGREAVIDRYIGYYEEYASSHEALDRDSAVQREVELAARMLALSVREGTGEERASGVEGTDAVRAK